MLDPGEYSNLALWDVRLRSYQREPVRAIADSVLQGLGRQFAVVFARQAGKDELLAQLLSYLLIRFVHKGGTVVVGAPTFHPQAAISRDRLIQRLDPHRNRIASHFGKTARLKESYEVQFGRAAAHFVTAQPGAGARGQTADLLLVANEAQDIRPEVWDAVFDPMAASTNATTLFLGTIWNRETLLARQLRHLEEQEAADGETRIWRVDWEQVTKELPAYGERVRARIAQFGLEHPFIRTEYRLLELDGDDRLFPPARLAQIQGDHLRYHRAQPGKRYALLLDVAGEEETSPDPTSFRLNTRRDATALTVIEIVQGERGEDGEGESSFTFLSPSPPHRLSPSRPVYRVVDRRVWVGEKHSALHQVLVDLARNVWGASMVVVDATGIGAGLTSFLRSELRERQEGQPGIRVVPFIFNAATKSKLGWDFLGLIGAGRFKEYIDDGDPVTREYWVQLAATTYETLPGPNRPLRWGVPTGRGHDDLVMSAALTAKLDEIDWRPRTARGVFDEEDWR